MRVARGQFCFVGAFRIGGGNGPTSANWKWADGKPFQYTNWSRDEPNNYMGHEDRVMIMGNGKCLCGNQPVRARTRQFFTKSFLGDGADWLAPSSGEEPAPARHRAGVASMAWRSARRFTTNAP